MKKFNLTNENNTSAYMTIEVAEGGKAFTASFDSQESSGSQTFKATRDTNNPIELLRDLDEQFGFFDDPGYPRTGWVWDGKAA